MGAGSECDMRLTFQMTESPADHGSPDEDAGVLLPFLPREHVRQPPEHVDNVREEGLVARRHRLDEVRRPTSEKLVPPFREPDRTIATEGQPKTSPKSCV